MRVNYSYPYVGTVCYVSAGTSDLAVYKGINDEQTEKSLTAAHANRIHPHCTISPLM